MARTSIHTLKTAYPNRVVIAGSFAPNNTGAVDQTTIKGKGIASVARDAAGEFTVTLSDTYYACESFIVSVSMNGVTNVAVQGGAVDVAAKTAKIHAHAAGTPADIAANANNRVNFILVMKNTAV